MLTKKIVLITGANIGIGFELASQLLADASTHVLLGSRSVEKGERSIRELQSQEKRGSIELVPLDVSSEDSIRAAATSVTKNHGRLDALVNNAAIGLFGRENLGEEMMQSFQTNAVGVQLMIQHFVPLLRKSTGTPRIINVSSASGSIQYQLSRRSTKSRLRALPYQASKAALNTISIQAYLTYDEEGIKVFLYCPGFCVSNISVHNTLENGALPVADGARPIVDIIDGKRDGDVGKFLKSDGGKNTQEDGLLSYYILYRIDLNRLGGKVNPAYFLVARSTGYQGGAAINALLNDAHTSIKPDNIYGITRDATGSSAARLAARGLMLITGNLSDPEPIFQQLHEHGADIGQTAAFLAQAHGPTELSDGRSFIDAALAVGLPYLVYSSVDRGCKEQSDRGPSYCKTFSDKYHVEKHLEAITSTAKSSGGTSMDYTILRPVWFADNAVWGLPGKLCMTGWRENMKGKRMQVVTTTDVGCWAAEALLRPDSSHLRNTTTSIASDQLTFAEADSICREETGAPVPVTYGWLARLMIWMVTDLRTMFAFIGERKYGADMAALQKTLAPTTFREWLRQTENRH